MNPVSEKSFSAYFYSFPLLYHIRPSSTFRYALIWTLPNLTVENIGNYLRECIDSPSVSETKCGGTWQSTLDILIHKACNVESVIFLGDSSEEWLMWVWKVL